MTKQCEHCKKEFDTKYKDQKYCSISCKKRHYRASRKDGKNLKNCEWCKKEFEAKRKDSSCCTRQCSRSAWEAGHPGYRAGRYKANHEKEKARLRARYRENSDIMKERSAAYAKANPEKIKRYRAEHYKANADAMRERTNTWREENPEKHKARLVAWRAANPERIKTQKTEWYDAGGFAKQSQARKNTAAKIKSDPVLLEKHRAQRHEVCARYRANKKLEASRLAYQADPLNAARIEAANLLRMTPEEKEKWHLKREAEQEKADRKERRDALRKELAAIDKTKEISKDPTWAGLEWSE